MQRNRWVAAAACLATVLGLGLLVGQATALGDRDLVDEDVAIEGIVPQRVAPLMAARSWSTVVLAADAGAAGAAAVAAATDRGEIATTTFGDRLVGAILSMDITGGLKMAGPQFQTELSVAASAVDSLAFKATAKTTGSDEVALTNGDRIIGTLSAITADAVIIDTEAAGQLKVSPKVVRAISLGGPENILAESNFASGKLDPWATRSSSWNIADNRLNFRSSGSNSPLYVKIDQKEAVTLVAKVQSTSGSLQADLVLCADGADDASDLNRFGRNSVFAMFRNSEVYLQYASQGGGYSMITNRSYNKSIQGGILRLSYDPETGKAHMWLDTNDLGEYAVPNKPTSGKFVMFNSYYPMAVDYVKLLRGVVPPTDRDDITGVGEADETLIQFANRDHVSAAHISLADGQLTLTTSYGDIKCPVKSITRIVFSKKGLEEPRRMKDDVMVSSSIGRMTFAFQRLTENELEGLSDNLGPVKLKRDSLREIKFNPHK
jgi:hypothetical protein